MSGYKKGSVEYFIIKNVTGAFVENLNLCAVFWTISW